LKKILLFYISILLCFNLFSQNSTITETFSYQTVTEMDAIILGFTEHKGMKKMFAIVDNSYELDDIKLYIHEYSQMFTETFISYNWKWKDDGYYCAYDVCEKTLVISYHPILNCIIFYYIVE